MLIAATAALTWYGRQGTNNPFARPHHVYVSGDSSWVFIKMSRQNDAGRPAFILLFARQSSTPAGRRIRIESPWVLLTTAYIGGLDTCFTAPPSCWHILHHHSASDTAVHIGAGGWPEPLVTNGEFSDGGVQCAFVPVFGDEKKQLALTYGDMKLIIADAAALPTGAVARSRFLEAFDIAVATGCGEEEAVRIRELLRPASIIAVGTPNRAAPAASRENIFFSPEGTFSYDCTKDWRGRIRCRQVTQDPAAHPSFIRTMRAFVHEIRNNT